MMTCTAKELCAATGGTLVQDGEGFSCVSTDSRRVEQGCLFIPLVGERFDGHTYLTQALESGAAGCLCSRLPEALVPGKFYVQVEDTLRALGQLAGWYREKFPIPVVQITGSAGKTTTKEMIASVLSRHFLTLKTEANYNNEIGTPQTLLRLMPEHQAAVIETGMDHFGQIRYLGEMVRPTVAVITNIGDAHIENLGNTRQGTLTGVAEIFNVGIPDVGDDRHRGTHHLPQIADLAEVIHACLDDRRLMLRHQAQQGLWRTDLVVVVGLGLEGKEMPAQHRGDHLLGGGLSGGAGDLHHGDGEFLPIPPRQLSQRPEGILHLHIELPRHQRLRQAAAQAARSAALQRLRQIGVAVKALTHQWDEQAALLHPAAVGADAGKALAVLHQRAAGGRTQLLCRTGHHVRCTPLAFRDSSTILSQRSA